MVTLKLNYNFKLSHNSFNMCTCGLPDISTLCPQARGQQGCGPQASGTRIRQTTRAHVTTIKYTTARSTFDLNYRCGIYMHKLLSVVQPQQSVRARLHREERVTDHARTLWRTRCIVQIWLHCCKTDCCYL